MKLYSIIMCFVFAGSYLVAMQQPAVRHIAYTDFIDEDSAFSQEFRQKLKNKTGAGAMQLLTNGKGYCIIDGVPQKNGGVGLVKIDIEAHFLSGIKIKFLDANGSQAMRGTLYWWMYKKAMLNDLHVTSCITGTVSCRIWDSFCKLCSVSTCAIEDASSFDCFFLRILLPYVHGRSFYAQWGYFPKTFNSFAEYTQACATLAHRLCSDVLSDCGNDNDSILTLRMSLLFCGLNSGVSLGTLVKKLYTTWRSNNTIQAQLAEKLLFGVYCYFLKEYPSCDRNAEIVALQKRVYESRYVTKSYTEKPCMQFPLKTVLVAVAAASSAVIVSQHLL